MKCFNNNKKEILQNKWTDNRKMLETHGIQKINKRKRQNHFRNGNQIIWKTKGN